MSMLASPLRMNTTKEDCSPFLMMASPFLYGCMLITLPMVCSSSGVNCLKHLEWNWMLSSRRTSSFWALRLACLTSVSLTFAASLTAVLSVCFFFSILAFFFFSRFFICCFFSSSLCCLCFLAMIDSIRSFSVLVMTFSPTRIDLVTAPAVSVLCPADSKLSLHKWSWKASASRGYSLRISLTSRCSKMITTHGSSALALWSW
mmetsp:Transcript_2797/g.10380  ORF Transcript_2797/g.10380 Transcript_2797/m.10380 type:complete len:203 (-) Transcript_2797:1331-1939(-)